LFVICFFTDLSSGYFICRIFRVTTEQVWLTTSEGVRLKVEIYKPFSVSAALPGIVVCHGLLASYQTMQSFSLEFAKRGFMVVAIDLQGHGDSDGSISIGTTSGTQTMRIMVMLRLLMMLA